MDVALCTPFGAGCHIHTRPGLRPGLRPAPATARAARFPRTGWCGWGEGTHAAMGQGPSDPLRHLRRLAPDLAGQEVQWDDAQLSFTAGARPLLLRG